MCGRYMRLEFFDGIINVKIKLIKFTFLCLTCHLLPPLTSCTSKVKTYMDIISNITLSVIGITTREKHFVFNRNERPHRTSKSKQCNVCYFRQTYRNLKNLKNAILSVILWKLSIISLHASESWGIVEDNCPCQFA